MKITKRAIITRSTITRSAATFGLDIKRCYLPFTMTAKCPVCGVVVKRDFAEDYVSYPMLGKQTTIHMYHGPCESEWKVRVTIDVTMVIATSPAD